MSTMENENTEEKEQDIDLGGIVDEARKIQPWVLSADRTIDGPYENYVTPELCIPEEPLFVPWESCLTLGADFTYEYGDHYKTPRELVNLLVNIVAKGGNMALNVSPQPDGRIPVDARESLYGFGQWMKTYGEAIYGTRVCAPYQSGNLSFTQKGDTVYAIRLYPVAQEAVESRIFVPYTGKISEIHMLDSGKEVAFTEADGGLTLTVPAGYEKGRVSETGCSILQNCPGIEKEKQAENQIYSDFCLFFICSFRVRTVSLPAEENLPSWSDPEWRRISSWNAQILFRCCF